MAQDPLAKITIQSTVIKVRLKDPEIRAIKIGIPGLTGPPGPKGDAGPAGPQGIAGSPGDYDIQTDDDVVIGQPLFMKQPGGTLGLAQADGLPQARVFGLATEDQSATVAVMVRTIGQVIRSDWTPVTGSVSLTRGDVYYLDESTAGMLTTTAPQAAGELVTRVGIAATSTTLDLHIMRPILKT